MTNVSFIYSVLLPTSIRKLNFYLLNYQYNKEHQYNKKACWVFGEGVLGEGVFGEGVFGEGTFGEGRCLGLSKHVAWHGPTKTETRIMHHQNGDNPGIRPFIPVSCGMVPQKKVPKKIHSLDLSSIVRSLGKGIPLSLHFFSPNIKGKWV